MPDELNEEYWTALEQGTLCEYEWSDIQNDAVGDPDDSAVMYRRSIGWYWGIKDDERGTTVVTFALTGDPKGRHQQSGWDCLPVECVHSVEILKRPKRRRQKRSPGEKPVVPSAIPPAEAEGVLQEANDMRHEAGGGEPPASSSRREKK